jgi:hypothetical protein
MTTPSKAAFRAELEAVDSAVAEMAHAVVAAKPMTPREALRVLRASWRAGRSGRRRQKAPRRRR